MRQVIARTLRAAVALVTLTLAQSAYWSPSAPWLFSVLVTALGALTAWRPAWGLVALAGLAPFGRMLAIVWLGGFPIRGAEALALACLAGAAVRWTVRPGTATDLPARVTIPWLLFAASAVASAAVLYRVSQVHLDYPAVFAERLLTFLAVGYHDLPGDPRPWAEPVGFGYVVATASVVEGVALLLVAGRLCVQSAAFARHLVVASVVAGAAAAALSMAAVSDAAATSGAVLDTLLRTIWTERWTVHVNKLNAAGSYFVLVCALGIGLAVLDRGRRFWWTALTTATAIGLWLTASMAAILSGFAVGIASGLIWMFAVRRDSRRRAVGLAVVLVLVTLAAARTSTRPDSLASFERRLAITQVSLAMAAERPLFGVGIDSYSQRALPHVTDEVRAGFGDGTLEAHNYVLQIAAELGLVGLGLFLGALLATFRQAASPGAAWAKPAAAAIAAFLLSALAGQPMLVDAVAIPMWLVMGVLAGGAPAARDGRNRSAWLAMGLAALAISVPVRMQREVSEIDPRRAGYGTTLVSLASGGPAHVLEGSATLLVRAAAPAIDLESAILEDANAGKVFLRVSGAGLPGTSVPLRPAGPRILCLPVDPGALGGREFRAVNVEAVTATGGPVQPGSVWAAATGRDRPCDR